MGSAAKRKTGATLAALACCAWLTAACTSAPDDKHSPPPRLSDMDGPEQPHMLVDFDHGAAADGVLEYHIVGSMTGQAAMGWGKIELLEGLQTFRTENYNSRTAKLRYADIYDDSQYPLQRYFGDLNQDLVDAFNLYYDHPCAADDQQTCPAPGPTMPEARFALLHQGPRTAAAQCGLNHTPVLLVHGAMQTANVFLWPYGYDGQGSFDDGDTPHPGLVFALEQASLCVYALTFGNFHGSNLAHATHIANAVQRIKQLSNSERVDVLAWSKGAIEVDLYLASPADWDDFSSSYFEQLTQQEALNVPRYRGDIGHYISLAGLHGGIDLNWRHPFGNLFILSGPPNAPAAAGPVSWGWFSAMSCATWGFYDLASQGSSPLWKSPCANRGGIWPDYWNRIYVSNIEGLDEEGRPSWNTSLKALNLAQGLSAADFDFASYNLAIWGSIDEAGRYQNAYLGQLQIVRDFRPTFPIQAREGLGWTDLDLDQSNYYQWIATKLAYNPYGTLGGWFTSTLEECRTTAYEPDVSPCMVQHLYYHSNNQGMYWGYSNYSLMGGVGIESAVQMGGKLLTYFRRHGISDDINRLTLFYGTDLGPSGNIVKEIDAMECPTCPTHSDGVLFDASSAPIEELTQHWPPESGSKAQAIALPISHMEIGADEQVFGEVLEVLLNQNP